MSLAPVPTFTCRLLDGELLAVDDKMLYALHPATQKVVLAMDLSTCDDARIELRRGAGSRTIDRTLLPLTPLLAGAALLLDAGSARWATAIGVGVIAFLVSWLSRRQLTPALVLRRGECERVLPLAFGGGLDELSRACSARLGRRRPIANAAELAAARERVRRYAAWSGNRLGGGG